MHITPELILKGFRECGYIHWDGNFDNLHSRLRETIVRQEVPLDVIAEVDNLVGIRTRKKGSNARR